MTTRKGYDSLIIYLNIKGADKAITFYQRAFGAEEVGRITMPGNRIAHAELKIGNSRLMIAEEMEEWGNKSPETLKGSPVGIYLSVDDVDTVFNRAIAEGAKIRDGMDVQDMFYGDRAGNLVDPFGHYWIISTNIKDMSWEEMQAASDKMLAGENK